jgi:hypothetical protein
MSLNSPKLQEEVALKSACSKLMFQLFQVFVVKLDRDVAYVAITTHICCKRLFQMFHLFQTYVAVFYLGVAYVSHLCCKCFIGILYMFHTYIASISFRYCIRFVMATHVFFSCFRRMFASVSTVSYVCYKCFLKMFQK